MFSRRAFLVLAGRSLPVGALPVLSEVAADGAPFKRIEAVAFDAFPVFNPRPLVALAEALFPGRGTELSREWRLRQFEYTWLRVAARHYADFWEVTKQALDFAAEKLQLPLARGQRDELMSGYLALKAWPDVLPALTSLKRSGLRLALLSNFTAAMLQANVRSAGLSGVFEQVLSTETARTYKPDPHAYQLGIDALKLRREEVLYVAFAGWDAAGAKLFGFPTFWANRQRDPAEKLDVRPDCTGDSLTELVRLLEGR